MTERTIAQLHQYRQSTSSSRMRVMNHNRPATKQRLHPQSVAEISCHSVLSGDRIRQCGTSSGSRHFFVNHHFRLQAPQCPCSVRKRFSRDHCCRVLIKHISKHYMFICVLSLHCCFAAWQVQCLLIFTGFFSVFL